MSCMALSPATCPCMEEAARRRCKAVASPGRTPTASPPCIPLAASTGSTLLGDASTWLAELHLCIRPSAGDAYLPPASHLSPYWLL